MTLAFGYSFVYCDRDMACSASNATTRIPSASLLYRRVKDRLYLTSPSALKLVLVSSSKGEEAARNTEPSRSLMAVERVPNGMKPNRQLHTQVQTRQHSIGAIVQRDRISVDAWTGRLDYRRHGASRAKQARSRRYDADYQRSGSRVRLQGSWCVEKEVLPSNEATPESAIVDADQLVLYF